MNERDPDYFNRLSIDVNELNDSDKETYKKILLKEFI